MSTAIARDKTLPIDELDALLVNHPFGNSAYVTQEMHAAYRRRLSKISAHLPVAGRLLDALSQTEPYSQYRIFGDTIVRCAIQHAHRQVETGAPYGLPLEQCAQVLQATIRLLEEGKCEPLGSGLSDRVGPEPNSGWIWDDGCQDDVFTRPFRHLIRDNYGTEPICTLNREELATFGQGVQLLSELLPLSSRSALSHVQIVVVFAAATDATPSSSSEYRLSGSIFLSRRLLASPWWVAEHLYHEALHQQLYDFRAGHSLLVPEFAREGAPRICSLWNMPDSARGNHWDVHRAIAAFHVYVHLALLATLAEQRPPEVKKLYTSLYGPSRMVGSRTACARAHYLAEQLRLPVYWQELGKAGKRIVDWFETVLEALDPAPPPKGAFVHLVLDRYWKEARQIENLLPTLGPASPFPNQLTQLAKDETKGARALLAAAQTEAELIRFDNEYALISEEKPGRDFVRARDIIVDTLLRLSPSREAYTLSESGVPDEMVRQMVEDSSERIRTIFGR